MRLAEALAEPGKEGIWDFNRSARHRVGILEHQTFHIREIETRAVVAEIGDLLGRNPALSADGRANVNSKRTPDQRGDTQFGETFQLGIDELAAHLRLLHLEISPKDSWVMGCDLNRHDDAAETSPSQVIDESNEEPAEYAALFRGRTEMRAIRNPYLL